MAWNGNKNWTWQLRDRKGRWIDMGRGVKWYDSTRKKEVSGTVVGSDSEGTAIVELTSEPAVNGQPQRASIKTNQVEAIKSKARIGAPATSPATVNRPDLNEDGLTDSEDDEVERLSGLIDRAEKAGQYDKTVRQEEQREAILQKGRKRLDGEEVPEDNAQEAVQPKATTAPDVQKEQVTGTTVDEINKELGFLEQEIEDITDASLDGPDMETAVANAEYEFKNDSGERYVVSPEPSLEGGWGVSLTKVGGGEVGRWDAEELSEDRGAFAKKLHDTANGINQKAEVPATEEPEVEEAPTPEGSGPADVDTVPLAQLDKLPTKDLIAQYDKAISSYKGRQTNTSPRQKRIDTIVDKISARADNGDADAEAWYELADSKATTPNNPEAPQEAPEEPKATATPETDSNASETPSESVEEAFARLGIERTEPFAMGKEKFPPTRQQQDVIDAVLAGKDTVVQAKAGAGKTTTLQALATRILDKEPNKKIVYVAFNSSVQQEAETRMPANVEARTGHSLSFNWVDPWARDRFKNKAKEKKISQPKKMAEHLGITNPIDTGNDEPLQPADIVMAAEKTVGNYAISADDNITKAHLAESVAELPEEAQNAVLDAAQDYWDDITNPEGRLPMEQDHMRKMWALSRPDFSNFMSSGLRRDADMLFIDEAQDTPPVLAKVVADQKMQKVIVGDADQAIYAFAGATDYLSKADKEVELPLNMSWRFGPEVADAGNRFLELLESKGRVVGGGPSSEVVSNMTDADAVLVRSNTGMLQEIAAETANGRNVGVAKKTFDEMNSFVETARWLMSKDRDSELAGKNVPYPTTKHKDLEPFYNFAQVRKAAAKGDNQRLSMFVNMADKIGVDGIEKIMDNVIVVDKKNPQGQSTGGGIGGDVNGVQFRVDKNGNLIAEGKSFENKDDLKAAGFKFIEGDEDAPIYGPRSKNAGQKMKFWGIRGDEAAQQAAVKKFAKRLGIEEVPEGEEPRVPDVIISTAHRAKGLEWDRVRIGNDFWAPKLNKETGELDLPAPEELRLNYVAVTRAQKALDVGSLGWVYDLTKENGGDPSVKEADTSEPDNAKEAENALPADSDDNTATTPFDPDEAPTIGEPVDNGEQDELDLGVGAKEVVDYTPENQDLIKGSDPEDEISYTDAQGDSTVYRRNNDGTWNEVVPDDDPTLEDLVIDENIPEDELMEMNKNRKLVPLNNAETDKEKEGSNEYIKNNPTAPNPVANPTAAPAPGFNPEDSADEPWSVGDIDSNIRKWPELAGAISRGNANENIDEALENDYNFIVANDDKKPFDVEFVRNEDNTSKIALKDFNTGETISEWPLTEDTDSAQVSDEIHKTINGTLPQKESEVSKSETGQPTGASPEPEEEQENAPDDTPESEQGEAPTPDSGTKDPRDLTDEEFSRLPIGTQLFTSVVYDNLPFGYIKKDDNSWVNKSMSGEISSETYTDEDVRKMVSINNRRPYNIEDDLYDWTPETSEEEPVTTPESTPVAEEEPEEAPAPEPEPTQAPTPSAAPSGANPIVGKAPNYPDGTQLTDMKSGEMIEKTNGEWHEAGDVSRTVDPASMENLVTTDMPSQDKKSFEPFGGIDSLERGDIILTTGGSQASVVGKKDGKVVVYPHNVPADQKALRPSIALVGTDKISGVNKFNGSGEEEATPSTPTSTPRSTPTTPSSAPSTRPARPSAPNAAPSNRGRTDLELVDSRGNSVVIGDTVTSAKGDTGEVIAVRPSDGPTGSVKFRMADGSIKTVRGNKMTKRDPEAESSADSTGGPDVSQMKPGEGGMAPDGRMFLVAKNGRAVFKGDRVTLGDGSVHIVEGVYVSLGSLGFKDENGKAFRRKASTVEAEDDGPDDNGGGGEEAPEPDNSPSTPAQGTPPRPEVDRFPEAFQEFAAEAFEANEVDMDAGLANLGDKFANRIARFNNRDMSLEEAHDLVDDLRSAARFKAISTLGDDDDNDTSYGTFLALKRLQEDMERTFPRPAPEVFGGSPIDASYDGSEGMREFDYASSPFNPLSEAGKDYRMMNAEYGTRHYPDSPAVTSEGVTLRSGVKVWDRNTGEYLGIVENVVGAWSGTPKATVVQVDPSRRQVYGGSRAKTYNFNEVETRDNSWNTAEDLDFSGSTSADEINTSMSERYPGVKFNFEAHDLDTAKEYAATVSKIFNKYPVLSSSVSAVGYDTFPMSKAGTLAAMRATIQNSNHLDSLISMNLNEVANARENARTHSNEGWLNNVPEGREVEYLMTHELGHALDYRSGNISQKQAFDIISEVWGKGDASKMTAAEFAQKIKGEVSNYSLFSDGSLNTVELVAESFADVELNGLDAKPISKAIHYALMEELKTAMEASDADLTNAGATATV